MFIKIQILDLMNNESPREICLNADKIVSIERYTSSIHDHFTIALGTTESDMAYSISPAEYERIEALLMPADEAEAKAPEWGTLKFESNLLMHVAEAYDAYKFCPMEDKNTQDSRPLRNVLIAAGNIYAARNNGEFNPYPFLATAPQADEAKAPEPAVPEWNKGVNTLAFSKLMNAWADNHAARQESSGPTLETIQAEKDAYFAVIDYIQKIQPPALPDDVKDAYQRYSAMCHQMDIVFSDASWLDARVSIIQAVAAHMPQQENKTDE